MTTRQTRQRRSSDTSAELSRPAIVDAALAIADADGLDAVTIRAVATRFGVTPMALYWHVANKDELLEAMGDRLFDGLAERVRCEGSWEVRLRRIMTELLTSLRAHPGSVSLAFPRILGCEEGRRVTDYALSVLEELGLPPDRRAFIACHLLEQAVMTVTAESASDAGGAAGDPVHQAKQDQLQALTAEQYPHLLPVLHLLVSDRDPCRTVSYADTGIEIFIAGIVALAAAQRRPMSGRRANAGPAVEKPARVRT